MQPHKYRIGDTYADSALIDLEVVVRSDRLTRWRGERRRDLEFLRILPILLNVVQCGGPMRLYVCGDIHLLLICQPDFEIGQLGGGDGAGLRRSLVRDR